MSKLTRKQKKELGLKRPLGLSGYAKAHTKDVCTRCDGRGQTDGEKCRRCKGTGLKGQDLIKELEQ